MHVPLVQMASATWEGKRCHHCTQEDLHFSGFGRKLFGYNQIQCQCVVTERTIQTYPAVECRSEVQEKCFELEECNFFFPGFIISELYLESVYSSLVG